jgi:hypothetical protein
MRVANRRSAIALGAALALTICVASVRAGKPQTIPAYVDGEIVYIIPGVSDNVVGVDRGAIARHANPIYVVLPVSGDDVQEVSHVLSIGLGAGYNPFWDVIYVTVNNGRDLSTDPFTSEDEILEAYQNGEVDLDDTGFILLCQVIGG